MATLSNNKGKPFIQFKLGGRTRTVRLGKIDRRTAQGVRLHVHRLVTAKATGQPADLDTMRWAGGIDDRLHAKLARAGLLEYRATAAGQTELKAYYDGYLKRRKDLKQNTKTNFEQTLKTLVAHFGAQHDIRRITRGDVRDWHRALLGRLSTATISLHVKKARQVFGDAVDRRIIPDNPFMSVKVGDQSNPDRFRYVPVADVQKVIDGTNDLEWQLIIALPRLAGLRVPSELLLLQWSDIDWHKLRMIVRSPKTEHHAGKGQRAVPIVPELATLLRDAFELADEGTRYVIVRHRGDNLRTTATKMIRRAGLEVWPKLFQNLRSSFETDLTARFPIHVACAWAGNSQAVAIKHYLQITERHFADAAGLALCSAAKGAAPEAALHQTLTETKGVEPPENPGGLQTRVPPRGAESFGARASDFRGIPRKVIERALARLEKAAPFIAQQERGRLGEMGVLS